MNYYSILIALFLGTLLHAQNPTEEHTSFFDNIQYGIRAGVNLSTLVGDTFNDNRFKTDFHIGGTVTKKITGPLSLHTELIYSREGVTPLGETKVTRTHYINLPILAKVEILKDWTVETGPQFSFLLTTISESTEGASRTLKRFDPVSLGIALGSSYQFSDKWLGGFRWNFIPSDVVRKNGGDREGTRAVNFQFSIGYLLN